MRDLLITLVIFGSVPFILRRPWIGALMFIWVSVMSPHRLTWGFAFNLPFAAVLAGSTLLGMLVTREARKLPVVPITVVLFLMVLWMNFTYLFAINADRAFIMWDKVMKIQLMVFVTLYLLNTRQHVHALMWVLAGSVAFFGIKGGIFTILGGGEQKVFGPEGSFIAENNALALATIMTIPLLRYLHLETRNVWVRRGLLAAMVLCFFSALGSQSRGALVAICAMLAFLWLKSRNKFVTGLMLAMLVPVGFAFMSDRWENRMKTIETYEEDASAMGRINAWWTAYNIAKDRPLTGGGFELTSDAVFAQYAPNPGAVHAAHSIYFQMLGEHGFVGLGLFLLLWFLVWREASWIKRKVRDWEEWHWAWNLANMIQVSLVAYAVGGAFLSLAYYDVPYNLIIAIVVTRILVEKEAQGRPGAARGWHPAASRTTPAAQEPRASGAAAATHDPPPPLAGLGGSPWSRVRPNRKG